MEEFEELRKVDYEYRRETIMDESEKLKLALDFLGIEQYLISLTVDFVVSLHLLLSHRFLLAWGIIQNIWDIYPF